MSNAIKMSPLQTAMEARGVTRRDFMKMCAAVAAAAGLSELAAPKVAQALEETVIGATEGNLYPVLWMEGASCTGCTESFAQVETPDPASVVLELISLNYCETLSQAAGYSVEEAKEQTIEKCAGNYLVVFEGAVLKGWDGNALRSAGEPIKDQLAKAAANAAAVVALGSCAVNGGWMGATPNSSDALGVQAYLAEEGIATPVINVPGCPANPEWLVSLLVDVLLLGSLPELDSESKPVAIFSQTVHENCERRGHFENGDFVYSFGSEEEAKGYCLYALGCRGPQTKANCGVVMWNNRRSWCVQAGAPCIGCCEANPNNPAQNWVEVNTPFYKRHRDLRIFDFTIQPTTIGVAVAAVVAAGLVIHSFGMKISGRIFVGAEIEDKRGWDKKHPDQSIGNYDLTDEQKQDAFIRNSTPSDKGRR